MDVTNKSTTGHTFINASGHWQNNRSETTEIKSNWHFKASYLLFFQVLQFVKVSQQLFNVALHVVLSTTTTKKVSLCYGMKESVCVVT